MAKKSRKAARKPSRFAVAVPDRRTLAYVLSAVVLLVAVFFLFTGRMLDSRSAAEVANAQSKQTVSQNEAKLRALENGTALPEDRSAKAERLDRMFPAQVDAAKVAADLATRASSSGVQVRQMDPSAAAAVPGSGDAKFTAFNVTAVGQPSALSSWMATLQNSPELMTLDKVKFSSGAAAGSSSSSSSNPAPGGTYQVTFTLKAYSSSLPALPLSSTNQSAVAPGALRAPAPQPAR